jgi:hypothetical protein
MRLEGAVMLGLLVASCASVPPAAPPVVAPKAAAPQSESPAPLDNNAARYACETLLGRCFSDEQVKAALTALNGKTPSIIVGVFFNKTAQQLDPEVVPRSFEQLIVDDKRLDYTAGVSLRERLLHTVEKTAVNEEVAIARQMGCDFLIAGVVETRESGVYALRASLESTKSGATLWSDSVVLHR